MGLDHLAAEVEAQPQAIAPGPGTGQSDKALKDPVALLGRYSGSGVGDADLHLTIHGQGRDEDLAATGCIRDGIFQQVVQDALQLCRVALGGGQIGGYLDLKIDVGAPGHGPRTLDGILYEAANVQWPVAQLFLGRLAFRRLQQALREVSEALRAALGNLQELKHGRWGVVRQRVAQHVQAAVDDRQGSAQIVNHELQRLLVHAGHLGQTLRLAGNHLQALCQPALFLDDGGACHICLLYTSDAADDLLCVDLGGRRIIKKKNTTLHEQQSTLQLRIPVST